MVDQSDKHDAQDERSGRPGVSRRTLLSTLGAGGALAAMNGHLERANGESIVATRQDETTTAQRDGNEIDPVFGFSAASEEVESPIEPDHEVELAVGPREGTPPEAPPDFFFEPTGLAVESGDTVRFTFATSHHTVTAYHPDGDRSQRVPDGVPAFSSPIIPTGGYWLYTFDTPGVHDIFCGPHEIFGMAMRIVVDEPTGGPGTEPVEPSPEEIPPESPEEHHGLPPLATAALVLEDPALDPQRVVDAETVSWRELDPASKQLLVEFGAPDDGTTTPTETDAETETTEAAAETETTTEE